MSTTRRSFFGVALGGFAAALGLKARPALTPTQELQKYVVTATPHGHGQTFVARLPWAEAVQRGRGMYSL
jgi:hypothetical protein